MLAKAPNRKRALEYLAASGAVPISVTERDGVCSIRTGSKSETVSDIISTVWLDERMAAPVAREARRLAGDRPDISAPRRHSASAGAITRDVAVNVQSA